ncbi:chemotaxis protein CheA [Sphingosinithalassobacter sp. LHW66-3]|uniref:chemotaxis protein CheA n=1 Tax=Sphingosinithalassobacter sp. LHW66-3 TaxID=3424718 RepID=UPI003D6C4DB1
MDDLLQEFIAETRETLEALSGEIVAWEAAPGDRARLDAIFRFVHTVKGSCGFLDLPRLGRLSHAAEDVLAQVRSGERTPDRGLVNAVLAVVDRIGEIVEAIDAGSSLDDSGEDLLISALAEGSDRIASATAPVPQRAPTRSVRLNVDLLDRMMSGMSDMVLARNELARRLRATEIEPEIEAALERMSHTVAELRDTVTRTRMQKIDALFSALPRMVRDTAAGLGKSVTLQIEGADVELDREMIELMRDPLVHMVRNSIDHGIESPAERRAAGKSENGRLTVSARQSGNQIIVEILDDGRGIDTDRLMRKLIANGTRDQRELQELSERQRLELVFEPGLSSRDEVTEFSGRGVGMDVVRACIEQIGGRIDLDNAPGKGLRIAVHVPLTLSIISAIVVGVGDQRFAISRPSIEEIVSERNASIRVDMLGGTPVVTVRERRLPMVDLGAMLGLAARAEPGARMLAIVSLGAASYALSVDTVIDNEELVIKPASPAVMAAGLYAGQTLPDSGLPMLLLDPAGIAATAGLDCGLGVVQSEEAAATETEQPGLPALLFVDLDGARRTVPLGIVDRVEQVTVDSIRRTAGRLRLAIDGRLLPLAAQGTFGDRDKLGVLRLKDGANEVAYAIDEACDIVMLPDEMAPSTAPGPVAGVVLLGDEQIELLDVHWLFAEHLDRDEGRELPLCLLTGGAVGWMGTFVRPLLEAAGYRVALGHTQGEAPAIVLSADDSEAPPLTGAPLLRLRSRRAAAGADDDSIYRYDRAGLLSALEARLSAKGGC